MKSISKHYVFITVTLKQDYFFRVQRAKIDRQVYF